jgi:hypothetical protein
MTIQCDGRQPRVSENNPKITGIFGFPAGGMQFAL